MQSPGNIPNSVMILVKGIAEVFTTFNENEFKIDYLRQGDIINHTLFLYQQPALLPIRCVINCEALILTFDKVEMLRTAKTESSLNRELDKILINAERVGFDKLFLDYIKKPRPTNMEQDEMALAKSNENHRRIKNVCIYLLADYRANNKKPLINEILQDVIQKDKEKRKALKLKMMQLMKFDEKKENEEDTEVLAPAQAQEIYDTVNSIEKQVEFQKQLVTSLQKKLWVALDGKESAISLQKLSTRIAKPRPSIRSSKMQIIRKSQDDLMSELESVGKDYAKLAPSNRGATIMVPGKGAPSAQKPTPAPPADSLNGSTAKAAKKPDPKDSKQEAPLAKNN